MSELIIDVCLIDNVKKHPNADSLEISIVKGWQVVVKKDSFKTGDKIVYFPPDSVLPVELSDRLGVTRYLSKGRVKSINLRSEPSHGFAVTFKDICEISDKQIGVNVAEILNVIKYEPPIKIPGVSNHNSRLRPSHPLMPKYTDIQNLRNYMKLFSDDEQLTATEKIHGTNSRVGYAFTEEKQKFEFIFGSHNVAFDDDDPDKIKNNYYDPLLNEKIRFALTDMKERFNAKSIIIYGEIYGWVQDLRYGHEQGKRSYRAFDIMVDGKYLDFHLFKVECERYGIEICPVIFDGTYSQLKEIGFENLCITGSKLASGQIMEGFVLKPQHEHFDHKIGRVVLKYVSDAYLTRKNGSENH